MTRARLTRTLAKIREDQGNISEASTILQELQVVRNSSYSTWLVTSNEGDAYGL